MARPIRIQQQHTFSAPSKVQCSPRTKHSRAHHRHIVKFRRMHRAVSYPTHERSHSTPPFTGFSEQLKIRGGCPRFGFCTWVLFFLEVAVVLKIVPRSSPVGTGQQGKTAQGLALTTWNSSRTLPTSP